MEITNLIFLLFVLSSSVKAIKTLDDIGLIDEDQDEDDNLVKLFPPTCGQPDIEPDINRKIVNGEAAKPNSWPWQVSLQVVDKGKYRHDCGGSIISNNIVLTAAHCIDDQSMFSLEVVAGAHNINKSEKIQTSKIQNVIRHSDYNEFNYLNDIAILFLESPLHFNDKVSPVCLPNKNSIASGLCYATGWGSTTRLRGPISAQLNQVRLPVVESFICNAYDSRLCTGLDKGKGACSGDSGGPFVCLNTSDKKWYLHGVGSTVTSKKCDQLTIFTRVVHYLDWINDHIISIE